MIFRRSSSISDGSLKKIRLGEAGGGGALSLILTFCDPFGWLSEEGKSSRTPLYYYTVGLPLFDIAGRSLEHVIPMASRRGETISSLYQLNNTSAFLFAFHVPCLWSLSGDDNIFLSPSPHHECCWPLTFSKTRTFSPNTRWLFKSQLATTYLLNGNQRDHCFLVFLPAQPTR